jgi:hypothetical protein
METHIITPVEMARRVADYLARNHAFTVIDLVDDVVEDLLKVWPTLTMADLTSGMAIVVLDKARSSRRSRG